MDIKDITRGSQTPSTQNYRITSVGELEKDQVFKVIEEKINPYFGFSPYYSVHDNEDGTFIYTVTTYTD